MNDSPKLLRTIWSVNPPTQTTVDRAFDVAVEVQYFKVIEEFFISPHIKPSPARLDWVFEDACQRGIIDIVQFMLESSTRWPSQESFEIGLSIAALNGNTEIMLAILATLVARKVSFADWMYDDAVYSASNRRDTEPLKILLHHPLAVALGKPSALTISQSLQVADLMNNPAVAHILRTYQNAG
jgi:hypothetical protein